MSTSSGGKWQKGQEVVVYCAAKDKWISGKIIDILKKDGQNVYGVEYEEYYCEIPEKDTRSILRIPKHHGQADDSDAEETFLNSYRQIPTQLSLSHQIRVLTQSAQSRVTQCMIHLYIAICRATLLYVTLSFAHLRRGHIRSSNLARCRRGCESGIVSEVGFCLWIECRVVANERVIEFDGI